jgi:hypothetical protein
MPDQLLSVALHGTAVSLRNRTPQPSYRVRELAYAISDLDRSSWPSRPFGNGRISPSLSPPYAVLTVCLTRRSSNANRKLTTNRPRVGRSKHAGNRFPWRVWSSSVAVVRQRSARTLALAGRRDSTSLARGNRRHRCRFRFESGALYRHGCPLQPTTLCAASGRATPR